MTARIFIKLIGVVLCILIVALAAVDILASRAAQSNYTETLTRELAEKCRLIAALYTTQPAADMDGKLRAIADAAGARFTIISSQGRVLVDSEADPDRMENHRNRPEVIAALAGRVGSSIRPSPTMGVSYLYVAVPGPHGAVRMAVPLSQVQEQVNAIRHRMLASTAIAFLPAVLIAAFFARYVSSRLAAIIDYVGKLAEGNFQARLKQSSRDELGLLGAKLNETGEKLQKVLEDFEREHQELEKLERIRKDFVINVSHELRTPLASIQGYTETLLDGAINDPAHNVRFLAIIRQNVERLSLLASDLLTLSRIELKTQKFHFASYCINTLLHDAVDAMRPMAEKKSIAVRHEPAPDGAEAFCDSKAVLQALGNLLENAIKYTPEGGRIDVGVRPVENGGKPPEFLELYVRDTGIGIHAEELPRLFERFYRVDKARSRELGGTGLGLAIVKHLARAQGGDVRVESETGKGSTFYFSLPIHDPGLPAGGDLQSELTVT